jgi:hypothetical protein
MPSCLHGGIFVGLLTETVWNDPTGGVKDECPRTKKANRY